MVGWPRAKKVGSSTTSRKSARLVLKRMCSLSLTLSNPLDFLGHVGHAEMYSFLAWFASTNANCDFETALAFLFLPFPISRPLSYSWPTFSSEYLAFSILYCRYLQLFKEGSLLTSEIRYWAGSLASLTHPLKSRYILFIECLWTANLFVYVSYSLMLYSLKTLFFGNRKD